MYSCHGVLTNQFYIITFFERFWREFRISHRSHKPVRKPKPLKMVFLTLYSNLLFIMRSWMERSFCFGEKKYSKMCLKIRNALGPGVSHVLVPKNRWMYLTIPVKSAKAATSECTCPQTTQELSWPMHCQKSITDTLDTVKIVKRFAYANEQRKGRFGKSE